MPTVLTTSTQHANLKHCDSLAFFTTQHLRPSDHTRALFQHARPDAGAGCCRGGTRAAAVHSGPVSRCTRYLCTLCMDRDVRTARLVLLLRSGMSPCAGRRVLQPSIMGHPCGLTGRQAGQATQTRGVQGVRADRQARRALRKRLVHVHGQGPPDRAARCGVRRPGICDHASALQQRQRRSAGAPLQNGLTTAVRSRFATRQCTLLHEQDPRDRAVWSAACSGCHPGQWWASGLFCMAVVQLWCT